MKSPRFGKRRCAGGTLNHPMTSKRIAAQRTAIGFILFFAFVAPAIGRDLAPSNLDESNLDRHGHYTNIDGDQVHQPAKEICPTERRRYAAMAITASVNTTRAPARGMAAWFGGFVKDRRT